MDILQPWANSLAIFKPANLKLFLLVTLNAIFQTYKILLIRFWWAVTLFFGVYFLVAFLVIHQQSNLPFLLMPLCNLCYMFMVFLLYLLIRPSVAKKNNAYVKSYGRYLIYAALFFCSIAPVLLGFGYVLAHIFYVPIVAIAIDIVSVGVDLFFFFFLDSDGAFISAWRSCLRACKMMVYTAPFLVIVVALRMLSFPLLSMVAKSSFFLANPVFTDMLADIAFILGMPLTVCLLNNWYIKNLHENFNLYFEHKGE